MFHQSGIRIDELEEALLEWLKDYIVKYEFTDTHEEDAAAIAAKEMIVTNFETEHQTLLKQRESLFDFLEQGIYTKEIFLERSNALEQRIMRLHEQYHCCPGRFTYNEFARQANRKNFCTRSARTCLSEWNSLDYPGKEQRFKETDRPDCTDQNKTE